MNQPYGLIPITLLVIFLYLISWGLTRIGEIRLITHRRLWNTLLLVTFLITAMLGILLVIQINYKLEISWIKKVLKWHVDFGIAMTFIALIHFGRHLRYYQEILTSFKNKSRFEKKEPLLPELASNKIFSRKSILTALVILGFSCILSQLVVIREFLNVFQGNELIIGMILCIWMLLTAAGSRVGQRFTGVAVNQKILSLFFLLQGILPVVILFLLYLVETQIFPPGTNKSLVTAFAFCLGLLSPFCLISGMLFTMLASTLSGIAGKNRVSVAYGWESGGSMLAGLLFSAFIAYLLKSFQVLSLIILINLVVYIWFMPLTRSDWKTFILPGILLILAMFLFLSPIDRWVKSLHFKNQELVYTKDTPYGNISVTLTTGQYNFYENGALLFSTENQIMQEEAVHFALIQHPLPEKILIVSGGIAGMAKEALKYPTVKNIDYFEINPWLVKAERRFSDTLSAPQLHVITRDARRWIKKVNPVYDAIIVNTPDPSNAQINRYYTLGFFAEVKHALRPNGVFSISLSPTLNYMSEDAKKINRIVYHTLKRAFQQVVVIPGERNYFIASDGNVRIDIAHGVQDAGIENDYVNPGYIEDDFLRQNSRLIMNEITGGSATANLDLAPLAYFSQISYWLSVFQEKGWIILMLLLILMLMALRKTSPAAAGIFTGGFAGASTEFLILIIFQILYGYVYQMLGIIVSFYMTGLTAGAILDIHLHRKVTVRSYIWLQFILLFLVILIPAMITFISGNSHVPEWIGPALLFIITAAIAFIAGLEFNTASQLEQQRFGKVTGNLYGTDLAGAACGTLLVSLICFPLLGLQYTCLLIAALILASIVVMFMSRKKYL
jgi:spermidine synthase